MKIFRHLTGAYLKCNKSRTAVTIFGVLFSVTLITAIATSVFSLQQSMAEAAALRSGEWHLRVGTLNPQAVETILADDRVLEAVSFQSLGESFSPIKADVDLQFRVSYKQVSPEAFRKLPIDLLSGRLPRNAQEVVVPSSLFGQGDFTEIGTTFTAEMRLGENEVANTGSQKYTLVGVYESGFWNEWEHEVMPVLSLLEKGSPSDLVLTLKKAGDATDLQNELSLQGFETAKNEVLLVMLGDAGIPAFTAVVYSLGSLLVAIVVFGSILLIRNAFSISVGERTRQFGILASVGATGKQLRRMVYYEAGFVSLVGIIGGLALGVLGTGVVLRFFGQNFAFLMGGEQELQLHVSPWILLVATLVSAGTVLLAAGGAARRAAKISPIEAVRQSTEIMLEKRSKRKGLGSLFGLEGTLATRNFSRSRRMHRSTVVSLFVSIVLFISAGAIGNYLQSHIGEAVSPKNHNFTYQPTKDCTALYPQIKQAAGVTGTTYAYVDSAAVQVGDEWEFAYWAVLADEDFKAYAQKAGVAEDACVAFNMIRSVDKVTGKRSTAPMVPQAAPVTLTLSENKGTITIDQYVQEGPVGFAGEYGNGLLLFQSLSTRKKLFPKWELGRECIYIASQSVSETRAAVKKILVDGGHTTGELYENGNMQEAQRALVAGINVFSLCFVALITLITVANVLNTIGTNLSLRRREFAVLKSLGMGERSFRKMLCFECLVYGVKALLWGLPCAFGVIVLVHRAINQGIATSFTVPWASIGMCVVGVFVLVLFSMAYAIRQGEKESIVEAIKNENA